MYRKALIILAFVASTLGCATVKHSNPCLTGEVPARKKLVLLTEPRGVELSTDDGQTISGVEITAEGESLEEFAKYVEKLEKMARWAKDRCSLKD